MSEYKVSGLIEFSLNTILEANDEEELERIIYDRFEQHKEEIKELLGFELSCGEICNFDSELIEEKPTNPNIERIHNYMGVIASNYNNFKKENDIHNETLFNGYELIAYYSMVLPREDEIEELYEDNYLIDYIGIYLQLKKAYEKSLEVYKSLGFTNIEYVEEEL